MPRTTTFIPEPDRALFQRCRTLNLEIADLLEHKEAESQTANLRLLLQQEIPPAARRKAETLIARAERDSARLAALQAELERISTDAETAAQRIVNPNLRRFVKLYALDGCAFREAVSGAGVCKRTIERYSAYLSSPIDPVASEGNADGQTYQTGAGG